MESPTKTSSQSPGRRAKPTIIVPPPRELSKDAVFIDAINKTMAAKQLQAEMQKSQSNQDYGSPTHQHHRYRNRIQSFYAADPNYIGLREERSTMVRHEHLAKRGMLPPEQLELQRTMALARSGTLTRFATNNMGSTTQMYVLLIDCTINMGSTTQMYVLLIDCTINMGSTTQMYVLLIDCTINRLYHQHGEHHSDVCTINRL
jgi:hypothetical protein